MTISEVFNNIEFLLLFMKIYMISFAEEASNAFNSTTLVFICGIGRQKNSSRVPISAQQKQIQLGTMWVAYSTPGFAALSGLSIRHCRKLWCRLQTRLRSDVAVSVA